MFIVREMKHSDLEAVVEVDQQSQDIPWSMALFLDALRPGYQSWVLVQEEKSVLGRSELVVGFAILQYIVDEATLLNLSLKSAWRGQGLGRQLLQWAISHCPSFIRILYLEVRESNALARKFYDSVGFNEFTIRRGYYPKRGGGREDAVLMQICLNLDKGFC